MTTINPNATTNAAAALAAKTGATNGSTSGSSNSTDALNGLSKDFNNFLTLLTTQLKNQDPLSPMDSTQFTQQLVAFTGVEQQINANNKLDQLIGLDKAGQITTAAGFIGSEVEANSSQLSTDGQGTPVQLGYTLPNQASVVAVQIKDANGILVRNLDGQVAKGHNTVSWDGKSDGGQIMPAGVYNISVQALGQDKQPMDGITTSIIGTVQNVTNDSTKGTQLTIGQVQVPLTAVTSVRKSS